VILGRFVVVMMRADVTESVVEESLSIALTTFAVGCFRSLGKQICS
jgi:hypothetical protein